LYHEEEESVIQFLGLSSFRLISFSYHWEEGRWSAVTARHHLNHLTYGQSKTLNRAFP
jgi:hypothetical protein